MNCYCGHDIKDHGGTKNFPTACLANNGLCNCMSYRPKPTAINPQVGGTYGRYPGQLYPNVSSAAPPRSSFVHNLSDFIDEVPDNVALKPTVRIPIKTYRKEFDADTVIFDYSKSLQSEYQDFHLRQWTGSRTTNYANTTLVTYQCDKCGYQIALPQSMQLMEIAIELCRQHIEQHHIKWGNSMAIVRAAAGEKKNYIVEIQSTLMLTQTNLQEALGKNALVVTVETAADMPPRKITNRDEAVMALLHVGYRALARAHHPDLGGSAATMALINRAKAELDSLLKEVM